MIFKNLSNNDFKNWEKLIQELWPMNTEEALETFGSENEVIIGCFDPMLIGAVHVSIRNDYVNGSESSPVGYIEGIVVTKNRRKEGIASQLLIEAEKYALHNGCIEMGSDIEIDNLDSLAFHLKNGYIEQERVICLTKKINRLEEEHERSNQKSDRSK